MAFIRPQPRNFRERIRNVRPSEWRFAGIAFCVTSFFVVLFLLESRYGYSPRPPRVVYFQSWPASDALSRADEAARSARPAPQPEGRPAS